MVTKCWSNSDTSAESHGLYFVAPLAVNQGDVDKVVGVW